MFHIFFGEFKHQRTYNYSKLYTNQIKCGQSIKNIEKKHQDNIYNILILQLIHMDIKNVFFFYLFSAKRRTKNERKGLSFASNLMKFTFKEENILQEFDKQF